MGILLSILLKTLGFGKLVMTWIWDAIKGIAKFAWNCPFQFLTLLLSIGLGFLGWYAVATYNILEETRVIVKEKEVFIKQQDAALKQYVKALDTEKTQHRKTIATNNRAIADLKRIADQALASARREAAKVEAKRLEYLALAAKYRAANPSTGTADERIDREQKTTDEFIKDWRKVE